MSSTISLFMKKELTCLPGLFNKYVSKYYNNALGNGMTWLFFIWLSLHFVFDKFINALLHQMKYPEYFRQRVISTLWNFGFSFFSFIYCFAILATNDFHVSELHTFNQFLQDKSSDNVPSQYILGFVILSTYYAQNALWEASQNGCNETVYYNLLVMTLSMFTYTKGWSEIVFALITISCLAQTVLEMAKMFFMQIYNKSLMKKLSQFWFGFHCLICFFMYAIILPLQFLIPCAKNFKNDINIHILILNLLLWGWYALSITQSAVYKMAKHYVYHMNDFSQTECKLTYLECCMFPIRTDAAYEIEQVKKEIERRKEVLHSKNKRPNKLALYQTLKCMVTVKRKLKQRRSANGGSPSCSSGSSSPSPSMISMDMNSMELNESTTIANGIVDELLSNIEMNDSCQEDEMKATKSE